MAGVSSGGLGGTPLALPDESSFNNGFLLGPGAELAGDDFTGMNLGGTC